MIGSHLPCLDGKNEWSGGLFPIKSMESQVTGGLDIPESQNPAQKKTESFTPSRVRPMILSFLVFFLQQKLVKGKMGSKENVKVCLWKREHFTRCGAGLPKVSNTKQCRAPTWCLPILMIPAVCFFGGELLASKNQHLLWRDLKDVKDF